MNVFIGCSSSEKISNKYLELTKEISSYLVSMDYNLVFGACSKSMMGICYYKFINNGKGVTSVTPDVYEDDLKNLEESRQIITSNIIIINQSVLLLITNINWTMNKILNLEKIFLKYLAEKNIYKSIITKVI